MLKTDDLVPWVVPKASLSLETDTTLMDAIKTTLFIEYAKDVCTLPNVK